uniref:Retinitis pigmentosa 1-like 1 protein n=1 Tax=Macrostomum lignano TaxID=282301 RepID=A0A1I8F4L9_9PLAT
RESDDVSGESQARVGESQARVRRESGEQSGESQTKSQARVRRVSGEESDESHGESQGENQARVRRESERVSGGEFRRRVRRESGDESGEVSESQARVRRESARVRSQSGRRSRPRSQARVVRREVRRGESGESQTRSGECARVRRESGESQRENQGESQARVRRESDESQARNVSACCYCRPRLRGGQAGPADCARFSTKWAISLCVCKFLVPGLGTFVAGLTVCCPCSDNPGFACGDLCQSACLQFGVALLQLAADSPLLSGLDLELRLGLHLHRQVQPLASSGRSSYWASPPGLASRRCDNFARRSRARPAFGMPLLPPPEYRGPEDRRRTRRRPYEEAVREELSRWRSQAVAQDAKHHGRPDDSAQPESRSQGGSVLQPSWLHRSLGTSPSPCRSPAGCKQAVAGSANGNYRRLTQPCGNKPVIPGSSSGLSQPSRAKFRQSLLRRPSRTERRVSGDFDRLRGVEFGPAAIPAPLLRRSGQGARAWPGVSLTLAGAAPDAAAALRSKAGTASSSSQGTFHRNVRRSSSSTAGGVAFEVLGGDDEKHLAAQAGEPQTTWRSAGGPDLRPQEEIRALQEAEEPQKGDTAKNGGGHAEASQRSNNDKVEKVSKECRGKKNGRREAHHG